MKAAKLPTTASKTACSLKNNGYTERSESCKSSVDLPAGILRCIALLQASAPTTRARKISDDLNRTRSIFEVHGFRTSVVHSPRSALSIYKDSCHLADLHKPPDSNRTKQEESASPSGREFLITMLGMHPNQNDIERWYAASIKNVHYLDIFCSKIRALCPDAVSKSIALESALDTCEIMARSIAATIEKDYIALNQMSNTKSDVKSCKESLIQRLSLLSASVPEHVAELVQLAIQADPRIRKQQLDREYERIEYQHSTCANALMQCFLDGNGCTIKDVYFKQSHLTTYERITIYFYDPIIDLTRPPRFTFLPALRRGIADGPDAIAEDMIESFWSNVLRHGYFATTEIRNEFTDDLRKFFLSGIAHDLTTPLKLNAHFTPEYALSFYVHGKAGSGKSALVKSFSPALNEAIGQHADPEVLVRFVKQNLNKPRKDIELELDLRPNNNDLSVMSIIQGRRMTMSQSKPGLVVIDLEEMSKNMSGSDPNQLETTQIISQRFSGRKSAFKEEDAAPRNSAKRGISGNASLITLFTSNYELEKPCAEALQRLDMFANIKCIHMSAVSGSDRVDFARAYVNQVVQDFFSEVKQVSEITLHIPVGEGDIRPLVRCLRMISFYICTLAAADKTATMTSSIVASVTQDDQPPGLTTLWVGGERMELHGSFDNLFPVIPKLFDNRVGRAVDGLSRIWGDSTNFSNLAQIMDLYFAKILAPAVVVSQNEMLIRYIVTSVAVQEDVHHIPGVDPAEYKMTRSLYDPTNTPNLRDDILKFGRGAYVAIELKCKDSDGQYCIREIIEDSPTMTAFSSSKSALYKSGLFFGVYVDGEITSELRSRASLIL